jgi:hypothetical protein
LVQYKEGYCFQGSNTRCGVLDAHQEEVGDAKKSAKPARLAKRRVFCDYYYL